ncbi:MULTISPECIES: hypothetical protein [unclassified Arthrobacter]|uniref:hypothetical protein n=1 Tax=unclassified Arthrobacter TaxID=235627 RepID=UPI002DFC522A|nr:MULTISPECIES: hypothetical protein [unclassified Arthrobacter]MEC5193491.1 hypothetical protein [Arthrobacter sp. MP_M4]MEC5204960.1 hypothetical protein [Arthrobacter sp. MP_M7]
MLTVNHEAFSVESDLAGGRLACPGCKGRLRPWGWARERLIRHGIGEGWSRVRHRPRRGRCSGCAATHVPLEAGLAARRADAAAVIAAAVEAKTAAGHGHRRIAARLGRPASTVRGWLRSFAASASGIAEEFTALAHRDGADAAGLWPAPAETPSGRALAAVTAYAGVLAARFGVAALAWQSAGLAASGPFFFSTGRWQHELAPYPGGRGRQG